MPKGSKEPNGRSRSLDASVSPDEAAHPNNADEGNVSPTNAVVPYVDPTAAEWFERCPTLKHIPLFGPVCGALGPKFTLSLGLCYTLSKGAAGNIINVSRQPMLMKRFGIDAVRYQRLASMYALGWSLKAFVAVVTDIFALFGYTKRWYLLFSSVAGAAFAFGYGALPAKPSSANTAAAFIFLTCLCKANLDILSEGHYSRLMRRNPKVGPAVVSWVWAMTFVGTLISACMMGPLSDAGLAYVGVFISGALQLVTGIFFIFNFYNERKNRVERMKDALLLRQERLKLRHMEEEEQQDQAALDEATLEAKKLYQKTVDADCVADADALAEQQLNGEPLQVTASADEEPFEVPEIKSCLCGVFEFNKDVFRRNWKIVAYSVLMACAIVVLTVVSIFGSKWDLLYSCIAIAVVCSACAFLALPLVIAKAMVFMFLNFVLYIQIPGALTNFYLAPEACLPDGPHFSYTFFNTIAALITNFAGMCGAVLFNCFFSKRSYRFSFIATTMLEIVASLFDLVMVKRWNMAIGIPDHAMYIFGDAIIYEVCWVMGFMPQQILMSRLCPRGTESMVFALLAGFASMGTSMSTAIGAILMETVWPVSSKVPCDYSNVPYLIITGHLCTPLLIIPLACLLLPSAKVSDDIDVDGKVLEKAGVVPKNHQPQAPTERQVADAELVTATVERNGTRAEPASETH